VILLKLLQLYTNTSRLGLRWFFISEENLSKMSLLFERNEEEKRWERT